MTEKYTVVQEKIAVQKNGPKKTQSRAGGPNAKKRKRYHLCPVQVFSFLRKKPFIIFLLLFMLLFDFEIYVFTSFFLLCFFYAFFLDLLDHMAFDIVYIFFSWTIIYFSWTTACFSWTIIYFLGPLSFYLFSYYIYFLEQKKDKGKGKR